MEGSAPLNGEEVVEDCIKITRFALWREHSYGPKKRRRKLLLLFGQLSARSGMELLT
jgi:hypothetical protein